MSEPKLEERKNGDPEKFLKPEKIEAKEKYEHKEIKEKPEKAEIKEKPEKWEIKEKPEKAEHKEKPEKFEHKEKPEKFEHKESFEKFQIPEKTLSPEINPKDIAENSQNPGDIEERLASLEAGVSSLRHFISGQQRPDLSRGALSQEPGSKKGGG